MGKTMICRLCGHPLRYMWDVRRMLFGKHYRVFRCICGLERGIKLPDGLGIRGLLEKIKELNADTGIK